VDNLTIFLNYTVCLITAEHDRLHCVTDENSLKMQDMKIPDVKMKDQTATRETARRESD